MKDVAPVGHADWSFVPFLFEGRAVPILRSLVYSLQLIPAEGQKPGCTTPTMSE